MHEKIVDIQNAFWKAYKDFLKDMDVKQYEQSVNALFEKYRNDRPMATVLRRPIMPGYQ